MSRNRAISSGDVAEALGHVAEVRAHDLLAQVLHQLVEQALRLRVGEPVLAELLDLPGASGGSVSRKASRIRASSSARNASAERSRSRISSSRSRTSSRGPEVQRVLLALRAALRRERARQGREPAPHPPLEQTVDRLAGVHPGQEVVRDLLEQVGRRQVGAEGVLRVVPARIPDAHGGPAYAASSGTERQSSRSVRGPDVLRRTGPRASAARLAVPGSNERGRAPISEVTSARRATRTPRIVRDDPAVALVSRARPDLRERRGLEQAPVQTPRASEDLAEAVTSTPPIRSPLPLGSAKPSRPTIATANAPVVPSTA